MRLRRMGRKKKPFYRIVVAESRFARDGRFIEAVGYYNPMTKPADISLKEDRIMHWLSNGVQPSKTVKNILQDKGLWLKWDLTKKKEDPAKIEAELKKWQEEKELKLKRIEAEKAQQAKETKKVEKKEAVKEEPKEEPKEEVKEEAKVAAEEAPKEEAAEVKKEDAAPAEESEKADA